MALQARCGPQHVSQDVLDAWKACTIASHELFQGEHNCSRESPKDKLLQTGIFLGIAAQRMVWYPFDPLFAALQWSQHIIELPAILYFKPFNIQRPDTLASLAAFVLTRIRNSHFPHCRRSSKTTAKAKPAQFLQRNHLKNKTNRNLMFADRLFCNDTIS